MAGIGFSLKKLFKDKSCFGYAKAYAWTGMVTTGPFVVMVCLILGVQLLYKFFEVTDYQRYLYIESVVYPFIFSHIVVSGFHMVITRYISDKMYEHDLKSVLSSMFGILSIVLAIGGIIGFLFFLWASLPFFLKLTIFLFYMEMMIILLLGSYVSALRNYTFIVRAYLYGVIAALIGTFAVLYVPWFEDTIVWTMLMMDIGAFIIAAFLLHNIYMFFGFENYFNYDFIDYFSKFKKLFFINIFYTTGLYSHNIIMWFGPEGVCISDTFYSQPQYDISTFFAYISILPVMMLFVINTEINFYEKFRRYLMFITEKGNYEEITQSREEMLQVMWSEIRNIFDFQLVAAFCFISVGNIVMPMVGLGFSGIDIYNILVLSAFCVGILQAVMIMLLYLEDKDGALMTTALMLVLSILFNLVSVYYLGEKTYGLGALLANFCALVFAVYRLNEYSAKIDYHIFCSQPVLEVKAEGFFSNLHEKLFKKEESLNG